MPSQQDRFPATLATPGSPAASSVSAPSERLGHLRARLVPPDAGALEQLITESAAAGALAALFAEAIAAGLYAPLVAALVRARRASALSALAQARPDYGVGQHNAAARAAVAAWRAVRDPRRPQTPYDVIIVPGYTPPGTDRPLALRQIPTAVARLAQAYRDHLDGVAPFFLVSGGAVHPAGTPWNEGLMMAELLIEKQVPAEHILIDPYARHSTTNLRNAGRIMRELGLVRGLVVTGFDSRFYVASQAFYYGAPVLSTFHLRSWRELGYLVGELTAIDEHHIGFTPSAAVTRRNDRDPLDV